MQSGREQKIKKVSFADQLQDVRVEHDALQGAQSSELVVHVSMPDEKIERSKDAQ